MQHSKFSVSTRFKNSSFQSKYTTPQESAQVWKAFKLLVLKGYQMERQGKLQIKWCMFPTPLQTWNCLFHLPAVEIHQNWIGGLLQSSWQKLAPVRRKIALPPRIISTWRILDQSWKTPKMDFNWIFCKSSKLSRLRSVVHTMRTDKTKKDLMWALA